MVRRGARVTDRDPGTRSCRDARSIVLPACHLDFSGFSIDIGIGLSSTAQSGELGEVVGDEVEPHLGNPRSRVHHLRYGELAMAQVKTPLEVAKERIQEAHRTQATDLDLSILDLTELPEALGHLTELYSLNLSGNQLGALPESLGQLTQLRILDASNNQLRALPESLGQLAHLEELYVSGNQLGALPESLGQLTQLRILDASNNQLRALPESLGQLAHLEELYVWGNELGALPESLGQLTQLRILDASNNQLRALPESLGQPAHLEELYVWGNQLGALPESLGQLTQLRILDASNNQLRALPESLGQLAHLELLIVWGNELGALPESLGKLALLQWLDASNNKLRALPESMGQLAQLRGLGFWGNQLTTLPESLLKLRSLTAIFLHGNDALGIPPGVLGPEWYKEAPPTNPSKPLDIYFQLRDGRRPLNEAKLMLVGRGGVGKTTLVDQLLTNKYVPDEERTEGIRISAWPLCLKDENVRLNIWDFGGQEIMHATHQFFLSQRSLYLLVLNGREGGEDADAEYWLKLIESFGVESPVIVVLNKIKKYHFNLNQRGLQQKYPAIRDFIKTDCQDGTGINQLRVVIEQETDHLAHLRDPFPASWFAIKDRLAEMGQRKENFITFKRYREICAEKGETKPAQQETLASYLHDLGIALNYKDDPRLRDAHVLNPHWVTNGIYTILNAPMLKDQNGELRIEQVAEILDPREYPLQMHNFLLRPDEEVRAVLQLPGRRVLLPDPRAAG